MLDYAWETEYARPLAGVDEAGRGPWAGPVVAAAVIFDPEQIPSGINDSKILSAKKRDALFEHIMACAQVGIGISEAEEIDRINILQATFVAMQRAVEQLRTSPTTILVDGNKLPSWHYPSHAIVNGDAKSVSIAAASIIAKVTRDRIMQEHARTYPHYGWERNSGYGTKHHQDGLRRYGITPLHRRSFAPIRAWVEQEQAA